jgi:hypothetical protein
MIICDICNAEIRKDDLYHRTVPSADICNTCLIDINPRFNSANNTHGNALKSDIVAIIEDEKLKKKK